MIPPDRKMVVEKSAALVAVRISISLSRVKRNADHHRCEYFEEAFNPEVNHPPAPVFGGDKMAALPVHQAG